MKKTLLTAVAALVAASAWSDGLNYFVLQQADGTCTPFTAVGTEITFADGNLIATNSATGQSATIPLSALSRMYFSEAEVTTGVEDIDDASEVSTVSVRASRIFVTGESGHRVTVVNLAGAVVGEATLSGNAATAVTPALQRGIYVVKVNDKATKIVVK